MRYVLAGVLGLIAGAVLELVVERIPRREQRVTPPRWRPPTIIVLSAALATLTVATRHGARDQALGLALIAVLIPVSFIDLERRLIPNMITGPAAAAALLIGLVTRPSGLPAQVIAGLAAFAFLFIFALVYPRGLGMGDVKLAGVLGLFLSSSVVVALVAGVLSSALLSIGVLAQRGVAAGRKVGFPFGPFLAFGGVVGILFGPHVVHWYVHSVVR